MIEDIDSNIKYDYNKFFEFFNFIDNLSENRLNITSSISQISLDIISSSLIEFSTINNDAWIEDFYLDLNLCNVKNFIFRDPQTLQVVFQIDLANIFENFFSLFNKKKFWELFCKCIDRTIDSINYTKNKNKEIAIKDFQDQLERINVNISKEYIQNLFTKNNIKEILKQKNFEMLDMNISNTLLIHPTNANVFWQHLEAIYKIINPYEKDNASKELISDIFQKVQDKCTDQENFNPQEFIMETVSSLMNPSMIEKFTNIFNSPNGGQNLLTNVLSMIPN